VNVIICKTLTKMAEFATIRRQIIEKGFLQQLILLLGSDEKDERTAARATLVSLSHDYENAPKILQMLSSKHLSLREYAKRTLHGVHILYNKVMPLQLMDPQEEMDLIETTIRAQEDSVENNSISSTSEIEEVLREKHDKQEQKLEQKMEKLDRTTSKSKIDKQRLKHSDKYAKSETSVPKG